MRIVRYMAAAARGPAVGILGEDEIAEIPATGGDLGPLLLLDRRALKQVAAAAIVHHDLADVRLLAPVERPGKILALAANYYPTDVEIPPGTGVDTPKVFIKPQTTLLGPGDTIPYHAVVEQLVEEIELGVIIGRPGKNISSERALEHVFGYTIINDVSARELHFPPDRAGLEKFGFFDWLNGKWLDGFCPVGPWIVDKTSLPSIEHLDLLTVVSDQIRIQSNTERMIFDVPQMIAYISRYCTLEPGDLIASGVALGLDGQDEILLRDGDVVEGTVEGIGTLRNPVRCLPA